MKEIQLTQGKVSLVDDSDYEYLNQWKWYAQKRGNTFYAKRTVYNDEGIAKCILMHRSILNVNNSKLFIDHIDRDGLNNQKINLRLVTHSANMKNRSSSKTATSIYLGVHKETKSYKDKKYYYWRCRLDNADKNYNLGTFPYTPEGEILAAKAYDIKAKEIHGEFANLNFK